MIIRLQDYLVSSVYRYGQQSLFHINEKQGEAIQSIIEQMGMKQLTNDTLNDTKMKRNIINV